MIPLPESSRSADQASGTLHDALIARHWCFGGMRKRKYRRIVRVILITKGGSNSRTRRRNLQPNHHNDSMFLCRLKKGFLMALSLLLQALADNNSSLLEPLPCWHGFRPDKTVDGQEGITLKRTA